MPENKKTVGRYIRLTDDADRKLDDLRRRLSVSEGKDLSNGDVIAKALDCICENAKKVK